MTKNLLTLDQASFETTASGWGIVNDATTPVSPVPINMFTQEQATMEVNYSTSVAPAITRACGWFGNGGTAEWSTDHAAAGTHSIKVLKTASAGWLAPAPTTLNTGNAGHACTPGETFTFMGQFWGIGITQVGLQVNFYNAAGAIVTNPVTNFPVTTTGWTALRKTFTAPVDAVRCLPQPTVNIPINAGWYMDQMAFYRGDVSVWYDPAVAWAQNILIPDAPTPRAELATFETNVNTGTGRVSGWQSWGGGSTAVWSTEQAAEGTHSLKSSNPGAAVGQTYAPRSAGSTTAYYPAKPFATYTFAFSAFPVTQDSAAQIQVRFNDATGTQLTIPVSTFIGLPGEWRHCVAQFTAPANTATIGQLLMSCWITAANGVVHFDRCALFEGSVGVWFHPDHLTLANPTDSGALDGTHVLGLTRIAPAGNVEARTTTTIAATPGKSYTGMVSIRRIKTGVGSVLLDFLDAGGAVLKTEIGSANLTPNTWGTARVNAVAPASTASVRLRVQVPNVDRDTTVVFDKAGLMDGNVLSWVPGGQTVPPEVVVVADGFHHRMEVLVLGLASDTPPIAVNRILPGGRIEPVRSAQSVVVSGGQAIFDDFDSPTDTPFQYQILQGGAEVARSAPVTLPSEGTFWLGEPNTGVWERVIPAANAIPQWTREAPVGVHRVLGRQDPVVVTEARWWAQGELTLYTLTPEMRDRLGNLWAFGVTLGFYGPTAVIGGIGRIYIAATTVDERRVSARGTQQEREWRADITQVAEPTGAAAAPVFVRWQDVVAAYATWQALVNGEHDWLDVMTGVPGRDVGPDVGWDW